MLDQFGKPCSTERSPLAAQLDGGSAPGTIVDWISSGVPISQPAPAGLARELLAERGLQLFGDSSVGPGTQSRHRIGYVCEKR